MDNGQSNNNSFFTAGQGREDFDYNESEVNLERNGTWAGPANANHDNSNLGANALNNLNQQPSSEQPKENSNILAAAPKPFIIEDVNPVANNPSSLDEAEDNKAKVFSSVNRVLNAKGNISSEVVSERKEKDRSLISDPAAYVDDFQEERDFVTEKLEGKH